MADEPKHGIAGAYYSSDGEKYYPVLECSCGWSTSRSAIIWEEAGWELDEHLAGRS